MGVADDAVHRQARPEGATWEVHVGTHVKIDGARLICNAPDVVIMELDVSVRSPAIADGSTPSALFVMLTTQGEVEDDRHRNTPQDPNVWTHVDLNGLDRDTWQLMTEVTSHVVRIVAFRTPER